MKKIIGIFIVTLLIMSIILPLVNSKDIENNINLQEKDCECNDIVNFRMGLFNYLDIPPLTKEQLLPDEIKPTPVIEELPDYYSWLDYEGQDWTTPAKSQFLPKYCGSCWAFGALGVIESVINIREGIPDLNIDLSEQYILSCLSSAGGCDGGWHNKALRYILANDSFGNFCNGIIPEACFPYKSDDTIPCDAKSDDWEEYLIPIAEYGVVSPSSQEGMKSCIMQYGPVSSYMLDTMNQTMWGYTNHNPDDYYLYDEETEGVGHIILIVGWKDDPSIGQGGYWICKNSKGPEFGYNGFFNIEYNSCQMSQPWWNSFWVDYDPESYDWHPVPKTNGPYNNSYYGLINEPLQFQGTADGEHPPFTYHWDFGDDSTSEEQNPSHTYTTPGEYMVTLTVTDDNDGSFYDITTAYIQETNQPPNTPIIEGQTQVNEGDTVWYNITFPDPDGSIVYLYVEAFDLESGIWWGPYLPGIERQGFSFEPEEGEYTIRAKAKDPYEVESDWAILEVSVPKIKTINDFNPWISRLIERFPFLEFLI